MSTLLNLKAKQKEMTAYKPSQNLPVQVVSYDIKGEEHAIIGQYQNDEGKMESVRVLLSEDPKKGERKNARAEIADKANPKHKAYVAEGGWLMIQGAYEKPSSGDVKTLQSRWIETISNGPNKGIGGRRMATINLLEKTDKRTIPKAIVTAYDTSNSMKVDTLDAIKASLLQFLKPEHDMLTPCATIRLSQNGNGLAVVAFGQKEKANANDEYATLVTAEASYNHFINGQQYKDLVIPHINDNSIQFEVIPGKRFTMPADSASKYFDAQGKIVKGTDDKNSLAEIISDIYGEKNEEGYREPRFTDSVVGIDVFKAKDGSESMVPFLRTFMPVNAKPQSMALEAIPTSFFKPEATLVKENKDISEAQDSATQAQEISLSPEEADAMAELDEIMNDKTSKPAP
jgi:hypothetical protein